MRNWKYSHKESYVCDKNEKKLEIQRYRRLYIPDYRRSYGGTYTKCNILKNTEG